MRAYFLCAPRPGPKPSGPRASIGRVALTPVLGPANSAKAGVVLGAYADAARRGALLVVPTAVDARHYARELAGDGVVLGSVVTFSGLAYGGGRRAQYAGRRVSELQRGRI